jgi:mono/diheme cytochrome c family protein
MSYTLKTLAMMLTLIFLSGLMTSVTYAQDPEQGQELWEQTVWQCRACHGQAGEGVFGAPLAGRSEGDDPISLDGWIEQVRSPRKRMPSFSDTQVSDEQLTNMYEYVMSLSFPEEPGFQRIELPDDAHPGQQLIVEKRCVACHSTSGIERTRYPDGEATPSVEATIQQLRTPFRRMPAYSAEQVSDEEAALITEFYLTQLAPVEQESSLVPTPLEKLIAGLGGEESLQGLKTLSLASSGSRWVHDEDLVPGGEAKMIGPFELQLNYDIGSDALRLDYTMESIGNERQVSEVVVGELGYFDGQAANFGPPGVSNMSSDRLVSIREHQRLVNPHLIVQEILADPSIVSEAGEVLHDGSVHHLLVIEDDGAPQTLYVSAGTGLPAKLETIETDGLRRDVPLEVFYYSWQPLDDDTNFPAEIYVAYDGEIVHKELRSAIEVNPDIDSALFEFPPEASPIFDEAVASRGETSHQYLQTFGAYGFPRDGLQQEVAAVELAPGVFHLTGGSHHSLAIEQDDSVVIAEAPLDEFRTWSPVTTMSTILQG